jgi:hypothetical protein
MPPSDDRAFDDPPHRPLWWPVLVAAVLLAVVGAAVGLLMGARAEERAAAQRQPAGPTRGTPAEVTRPPAPASPSPSAPACPPQTQTAARAFGPTGTLVVVLRIRTASSRVWICSDAAGRLFYQANRGGPQDPWIEGKTALLVPDAVPYGDGYRATTADDGGRTAFDVSGERLLITHPDGRQEYQAAR